MPPVLGPVSPSPTRLWSWAGASGTARSPSHTASSDSSGPDEALLDHDRAAGVAEGRARQLGPHVVLGLGQRLGDEHALARGQAVGLDHVGRRQRARGRRAARLGVGEGAVSGRWARRRRRAPPSSTPSSPPAGRRRPRGRTRGGPGPAAGRPGRRPAAPRGRSRRGRRRCPPGRRRAVDPGMPGLPGVTTTSSAVRAEHLGQGVLPAAAARPRRPASR